MALPASLEATALNVVVTVSDHVSLFVVADYPTSINGAHRSAIKGNLGARVTGSSRCLVQLGLAKPVGTSWKSALEEQGFRAAGRDNQCSLADRKDLSGMVRFWVA